MRLVIYLIMLALINTLILMPPHLRLGPLNLYRPRIDLRMGGFRFFRDLQFHLGLDLKGGTHLVYQADVTGIDPARRDQALVSIKDNLQRRTNLLGVSESLIQTSRSGSSYRLVVELPGVTDINQALATIGQTARLEFRQASQATPGAELEFTPTDLSGADLRSASVQFGAGQTLSSAPVVSLEFTPVGTRKFAEITKNNIGKPLAIFLDDQLVTAPTVQQGIDTGQAVISGDFTVEDAKRLSIQLNAGALPVPIEVVEQKNIGATLGTESVLKSLFAGAVGLVVVWLFMLSGYGRQGLVANLALSLYILISLSLFKLIPVTLTLAGIAGFILSIGMAVDANILIFERFKEELRWGRPVRAALELAFHRAWSSVRDSNISSLITCLILFWFGSGPVRGFALTLSVGILVSLFTSVTITRGLLRLIYSRVK